MLVKVYFFYKGPGQGQILGLHEPHIPDRTIDHCEATDFHFSPNFIAFSHHLKCFPIARIKVVQLLRNPMLGHSPCVLRHR
jgi:hypothetical protein